MSDPLCSERRDKTEVHEQMHCERKLTIKMMMILMLINAIRGITKRCKLEGYLAQSEPVERTSDNKSLER